MASKTNHTRRKFTTEFKRAVVDEWLASRGKIGASAAIVGKKHGIHESLVREWTRNMTAIGAPDADEANRIKIAKAKAADPGQFELHPNGSRIFPASFKDKVAKRIMAGERPAHVAAQYGIADSILYTWARNLRDTGSATKPTGAMAHKAKPKRLFVRGNGRPYSEYTDASKLAAVERIKAGERVSVVAADVGASDALVRIWGKNLAAYGSVHKPRGTATAEANNGNGKAIVHTPVVVASRTDGRLEHWIKGDRAHLLQVIGMQTVEIIRLKEH